MLKINKDDIYIEEFLDITKIRNNFTDTIDAKEYYSDLEKYIKLNYILIEEVVALKYLELCDKDYYNFNCWDNSKETFDNVKFLNNYKIIKIYNKYTDKILTTCTRGEYRRKSKVEFEINV